MLTYNQLQSKDLSSAGNVSSTGFQTPERDYSKFSLQEIVETPKYRQLLSELKTVLKTELHAHLGGAITIDFIQKCASAQEFDKITSFIEKLKKGIDYQEGFKVFPMIGSLLNTNARIEEAAYEFCRSQYNDNVTFTELRTGLKKLDGEFKDYLKAVMDGLEKGMKDFGIRVTLLLSLRRDTLKPDAKETIKLAIQHKGDILRGIDVSGESTKGDGSGIFKALNRAKLHGLPITLHIGENKNETPEQQLKEITNIQPSRVGHAVLISPAVKQWIIDNQIPIEACIRSALSVGMISKPSDHPALELFLQGHPVVFCTDDSTLFGDLSEELALVACLCNLSVAEVIKMQKNAIDIAFKSLPKTEIA